MRVLVTGGTGFVGRAVVRSLVAVGHDVRLALRSTAPAMGFDSLLVGELGPSTDWQIALEGVDAVVHLAARVHVMHDDAGAAEEFRRTNTEGTLRLARASADAGIRRFVFVSTIKVNGEATDGRPFRADDEPRPVDPYGRSKLEAELGLQRIAGLESVVIRPPLVHGPGAKGNLARFCRLARSGWPVPLGGIHNRRDLVGVENLASLILRCLEHPAAAGRTFLVSDGEPLSTRQLYRLIAEAMGRPARLVSVPVGLMRIAARLAGMSGEVDRLTQSLELDITPTRELLDWSPPVPAAAGIATMAQAYVSSRS